MTLLLHCLALGIAALFMGAVLPGCDDFRPMAAGTREVTAALDSECKSALQDYRLLDKIAEAQWRARDIDAMDATYDQIVKVIEEHRRCFH